jgi:hypothetical protein
VPDEHLPQVSFSPPYIVTMRVVDLVQERRVG